MSERIVTHRLSLDVTNQAVQATVTLAYGDMATHRLVVSLRHGAEDLKLPPGSHAVAVQDNGVDVLDNVIVYGPDSVYPNCIVYDVTTAVTGTEGAHKASFVISYVDELGELMTLISPAILLIVKEGVLKSSDILESEPYSRLVRMKDEIESDVDKKLSEFESDVDEKLSEFESDVDEKLDALDGRVRLYPSDFVSGYFAAGTGIAESYTWIITQNGTPVKKGDKIKIKPNGQVVLLYIESVSNLADVTQHLQEAINITEETEIVSNYDGYAFVQVRDSAWGGMKPEACACEVVFGESKHDALEAKIAAVDEKVESKHLVVSPKQKPFTTILNDCQDTSIWTITNDNGLAAVDTEDYILGSQSLHCNKIMRCSKVTYDLTKNYLVLKLKINQIANGAYLYLKIGNTAYPSNLISYQIMCGESTTPVGEWREITIPLYGFEGWCLDNAKIVDFSAINDIFLAASGTVDWNLQYIGVRPIQLKKPIITFTFDDGYKSQYTGIKALAEKGITSTLFHIKKATDTGNSAYLSLSDLQNLVNHYDTDIEVHGDPSYDEWEEADLVAHWAETQQWLKANGLGEGKHMAYPENMHPANVVQLARAYFDSCRTIHCYTPSETYPPADRYRIRAVSSIGAAGKTVATVKDYIDRAVLSNAWLVLVFHRIGEGTGDSMDCSVADLQEIADYAIASGAHIMNYAEVFDSGILLQ